MTTRTSALVWNIPWTEKPAGLQSMGSQESDTTKRLNTHTHTQITTPIKHLQDEVQSLFFHRPSSDFWKFSWPLVPSTVFPPQWRLMSTAPRCCVQHFSPMHPSSPPLHPCELGTATVMPLPREGNRSAKKPSVLPRSHSQEVRQPGLKTQSLAPAASHTCWGPATAVIMNCSTPASRRYLSQWTHRFRVWALYFSKVLRSGKFLRGLIKGK